MKFIRFSSLYTYETTGNFSGTNTTDQNKQKKNNKSNEETKQRKNSINKNKKRAVTGRYTQNHQKYMQKQA